MSRYKYVPRQKPVQYIYDARDDRRRKRMKEQAERRHAERIFTIQTVLYGLIFFGVLTWASGILH